MRLTIKQTKALDYLQDNRTTEVLYGGAAGGGKTALGCYWQIKNRIKYAGSRGLIGRAVMKSLKETTLQTFFEVAAWQGLKKDVHYYLTGSNDKERPNCIIFYNQSFIFLKDLAYYPSDPEFSELGSLEITDAFIEECGGIDFRAKDILTSRIRFRLDEYGLKPKLLMTANPAKNWLYQTFYKPDRDGELPYFRKFVAALPGENPYLSASYIESLTRLDHVTRARLLEGNWDYESDPLSLIEYRAIADLFGNDHVPIGSKRYLICDVAMHGSDIFRAGAFYGDVLMDHRAIPKSGGLQVLKTIQDMRAKHGIPPSHVLYDADGVGAFIGQRGGFIPGAIPFHGGAVAIKMPNDTGTEYANLKSQCGFLLAAKINDAKMWAKAVTAEHDRQMLSEELSFIKKAAEYTDGKLKLMSKPLIIQALGRSPDFSDLWLMKCYFDLLEAAKKRTVSFA